MRSRQARDAVFAAIVQAERPLLQAVGYLLTGSGPRSEQLVRSSFASLYGQRTPIRAGRMSALNGLLKAARQGRPLAWAGGPSVQLIDGSSPPAAAIVGDLLDLPWEPRVAIVLEEIAGLSTGQISVLLDVSSERVLDHVRTARSMLDARDSDRRQAGVLAAQLHAGVPADLAGTPDPAADLRRGRRLRRRSRGRRFGLASAALVLLALTAGQLHQLNQSPPPRPGTCRDGDQSCRVQRLSDWRLEMAAVIEEHLDPTGRYFTDTGYRFAGSWPPTWVPDNIPQTVVVMRPRGGATVVSVEFAADIATATPCGMTTANPCRPLGRLFGRRTAVTATKSVADGLEVQYRPGGSAVFTVIARNEQPGVPFDVSVADLVELARDSRLRLPS